jgi:hypothetical protein
LRSRPAAKQRRDDYICGLIEEWSGNGVLVAGKEQGIKPLFG